ncbi:MAG: nucleotidyltransferase domain-containing protein [Candidatus Thorarchaeota archaeon]|jgi:predicted nucleotidyltransferase
MNKVQELAKKGLISPPKWLPENVMYLTVMGSVAYGVSAGDSDFDVYGFAVPPKDLVFPHLKGEIPGFGRQVNRFEQWQQHHIIDKDALGGKGREYDFAVYSIVKFFHLCMTSSPDKVDSLFTPARCVLTRTPIWEMVRENREMFLNKKCFHTYRGYAHQQLHRMEPKYKDGELVLPTGKRRPLVEKYGYDVKFAYHLLRLFLECEQILEEHTLDLERHGEILKSVRRGEWSLEQIKGWAGQKEKHLDDLYHSSTLRHSPDEDAIKQLLLDCLEHHYGDLSKAIVVPGKERAALEEILRIAERGLK